MENENLTINHSEKIDQITLAMVQVQADLGGAKKNESNPFYNSGYADLRACFEASRKILTDNGIAVIQMNGGSSDEPSVITLLAHTSGQWFRGELKMRPEKKGPQAIGSLITYARRYSYSAMIGLHQEDDDGNKADILEGEFDGAGKKPPTKQRINGGSKGKISQGKAALFQRDIDKVEKANPNSQIPEWLKTGWGITDVKDIWEKDYEEIRDQFKTTYIDDVPF